MDMRDRVDQGLGGFERIVKKVPGYRGYKEKEMAREADKLLREQLSADLRQANDRLADVQRQLLSAGALGAMADIDLAMRRLQTLADTVRTASYGYAGLFDAVKIKEAELNALYEHDATLLEDIPTLEAAIGAVEVAAEDAAALKDAVAELLTVVGDLRRTWDGRRDAILSLGGSDQA